VSRPLSEAQRQRRDAAHARFIQTPEAREEALAHARAIDEALRQGTARRLASAAGWGPERQSTVHQGDYEGLAERVAAGPRWSRGGVGELDGRLS
jgi:hypothetical protein